MGDWLGFILIVGLLVAGLFGLSHLGKPPRRLTEDEFERRVKEAQSAGPAVLHAIQKLADPRAAAAVEVQKDLRAGFYDDHEEADGDDDSEAEGKRRQEKG